MLPLCGLFLLVLGVTNASAQPSVSEGVPAWQQRATAIGVARNGTSIQAVRGATPAVGDPRPRVLYVIAPVSRQAFDRIAVGLLEAIGDDAMICRSVIVPREFAADDASGDPTRGHPPEGGFYDHPTRPEARYVWRWIGMEAPDLVVEVAYGPGETWFVPDVDLPQLRDLSLRLPGAQPLPPSDHLASQLVVERPAGVGVVPAVRVVTDGPHFVATLEAAVTRMRLPPSPARVELKRRAARSARDIAAQLLAVYGQKLDNVQYIPALALIGRLRQERIDHGPTAGPAPIVLAATAPFVTGGKSALDGPGGSSVYPGHLVFGELAAMSGDRRCVDLVRAAANAAFDADGTPREAMPQHNEMSDAVFMGCPVLAQAAALTGEAKYADACVRNLRFIRGLCRRADGLYRHSPLDEAAWGRGNGFPALGLCWSLDELPESSPVRDELLAAHREHLTALLPHQDSTGCWHQVIDRPESYREFTATAMITYALMRGIRAGRLDARSYGPAVERAWEAIRLRVAVDGGLVDVCTGTGKQKNLRDYYDRPAILGRDDRGGAMALLVATERQLYELLRESPR